MNGIQVEYKDFMIQPSDSTAAGKKKKKVSLSMDTKCYPEELPPSPPLLAIQELIVVSAAAGM